MTSAELAALRIEMTHLRARCRAETPIGHRCSNIITLIEELPRPPSEWIDYLVPDVVRDQWAAGQASLRRQAADIHQQLRART